MSICGGIQLVGGGHSFADCGVGGGFFGYVLYLLLKAAFGRWLLPPNPPVRRLVLALGIWISSGGAGRLRLWRDALGNRRIFGPTPQSYLIIAGTNKAIPFFENHLHVSLNWKDIIVVGTTLLTLAVLYFLVRHTRVGKAMRAVSELRFGTVNGNRFERDHLFHLRFGLDDRRDWRLFVRAQ